MCRSLEWVRVFRCFGPWPPSRHPSGGWAIPRAPWWCPQFVMQVVVLTSLDHCSRSLCVSTRLLQSFAISYAVLASGRSKHIPGAAGRGPNYCSVISAPDLPPLEAKRLAPNPKKKKSCRKVPNVDRLGPASTGQTFCPAPSCRSHNSSPRLMRYEE